MFYLVTFITSLLLVTGQALWKHAIELVGFHFNLKSMITLLLNPFTIAGIIIYGIATLLYFYALSKFQYSTTQGVVVSLTLIFTFIAARYAFQERIMTIHVVGLVILLVGVVLITRK